MVYVPVHRNQPVYGKQVVNGWVQFNVIYLQLGWVQFNIFTVIYSNWFKTNI